MSSHLDSHESSRLSPLPSAPLSRADSVPPRGSEPPRINYDDDKDRDRARDRSRSRSRSRSRERDYVRRESAAPPSRPHHAPTDPPKSEVLGVFGLSIRTTEDALGEEFSRFGKVVKVTIVYDQRTDRSRGFGFIEMGSVEDAERCVQNLNGLDLNGRRIRVDFSVTTRPHNPTPGEYMGAKRRDDTRAHRSGGGGGGGGRDRYDRYDRGGSYRGGSYGGDYGGGSYDRYDDRRPSRYDDRRRDDFGRDRDRDRDYDRDDYGRSSRDRYSPRRERRYSPSPPPRARRSYSRSPAHAIAPKDYDNAPAENAGLAVRW